MPKKRVFTALLIFSLSVLLFSMYSENVLAGCCVYPTNQGGGCSIYMTGGTCSGGSPDTKDCTEITKCNVGCWCDINDPVKNQIGYVNSGSGGVGFSGSFKLLSEYKPNPSAECDVICTGTKCTKDIKIICPNNDEITIATCDVGSGTIKIIGNNCGTPIAWTDEAKAAAGTTEIPVDECSNEIKDSGETDIDCGGSCPKCADGKSCSLNSDCQNNNCVNDVCTSNLCGNGVCDTGENSQNCIYDCNVCTDDILFNEECNSGSSCIKGTCLSSCKCDYTCIDNPPAPSNVQVLDVKNQKALSVEWNMIAKSGCDLSQILVYRCGEEGNTAECDPTDLVGEITPSLSLVNYNFPDKKEIKPETMYCYKVTAYYKNSGAEASSDVVCDTTGMEKCMEGRSKFCEENTLQTCNDNNDRENPAGYPCRTENNQDPRDIQYCLELDNGNAQCVFQNDCDLCNGVFGLFASSGETLRKISLTGGGTSYGFYSCKSLADGNELKTCFFDVTKTNVDKYNKCSDILSCYSYGSKTACEDDRCGAGSVQGCEWKSSEAAASEFGVGVCRPKDPEKQDCSLCSGEIRESKNMFFGTCSYDTCKLYGDCYYSDLGGVFGDKDCLPKSAVGCTYSTKEDCIGKPDAEKDIKVDVTYENGERTGTTNRITQQSSDYFSFGTCKWQTYTDMDGLSQGVCIKDADGDNAPDCPVNGVDYQACIADNTPPTTNIVHDVPVDSSGRLILGDDVYLQVETDEAAKTYFCFAAGDGTCYPDESTACAIQKRFDTESGPYTLYYYSEDLAHNLEKVKSVNVMIDRTPPDVNVTADRINDKIYTVTMDNDGPEATCSGHLEDAVGLHLYNSIFVDNEIIAGNSAITRTYTNLPDDRYYFVYECRTLAGNKVNGEVEFDVDTDNIHNPLPFGAYSGSSVVISVETDKTADCKYAEPTGSDQKFADMNLLTMKSSGSRFIHSSTVSVTSGEPISYDIKCLFEDGTTQGNKGDMIRFAVDNIPPEITAISTMKEYVFDPSNAYSSGQTLMLKCEDKDILNHFGKKHMDSGCDETSYHTAAIPEETTFSGEGPSNLFTINSSDVITYTTQDKNGNSIHDGTINLEITQIPELDVSVFKSPMQDTSVKVGAVSYGEYIIKVSSTETLAAVKADIKNISIAGKPDMPIKATYWKKEDSGKSYYFRFSIPATVPSDLSMTIEIDANGVISKAGEFCSDRIVSDENTIQKHLSLGFDTSVPTARLLPDLSTYKSYGYPLSSLTDGVYYTGQQKLFVSGTAAVPATARVNFYVMPQGSNIKKQQFYDMASNKDDYETQTEMNGFTGNELNDYIENFLISSLPGTIKDDMDNGKAYIDFKSKIRRVYGHFGEYYGIQSVNYATGMIKLDGKLEDDIKETTDKFTMHKVPHAKDWFGTYIELERGFNTFFITAESSAGFENMNDPKKPIQYYTIFYDPDVPQVIKQSPSWGTTNNKNPVISILVRKPRDSSPLDINNVKLYLNDVLRSIPANNKKSYSDSNYDYYNISYQQTLADGSYYVKFEGTDAALNPLTATDSASPEWVFIVNKDAPSRPIFNVIGGVLHDGIWYVKESPQFTLFFSEPVKIWSYVKNYVDPNNFDYLSSNCVGTKDSNFFDGCTFNPSITSTPIGSTVEDVHQIVVMAGKVLNGNIYGPASPIYLDPVIIDNITPDIQSVQDLEKIRENYDKIFKVKVLNEAHDLNATLIYPPDACLSENNYPLTQVAKDGTDYYFKWEIPACNRIESKLAEGDKKISIKVADYAGNSDTYDTTTYLDLTPPKIEDINLEVMPTRTIAIGNYTTKETEIIIKGTFAEKDTDVKSVSILFDDYVPPKDMDNPNADEVEKAPQIAGIYGGNKFELSTTLIGEFNMSFVNRMTVQIEDDAGYVASRRLSVIADLQAPYVVGTEVK